MLGKYSKFASAGDKAAVRQTLSMPAASAPAATEAAVEDSPAPAAAPTETPKADEAPF